MWIFSNNNKYTLKLVNHGQVGDTKISFDSRLDSKWSLIGPTLFYDTSSLGKYVACKQRDKSDLYLAKISPVSHHAMVEVGLLQELQGIDCVVKVHDTWLYCGYVTIILSWIPYTFNDRLRYIRTLKLKNAVALCQRENARVVRHLFNKSGVCAITGNIMFDLSWNGVLFDFSSGIFCKRNVPNKEALERALRYAEETPCLLGTSNANIKMYPAI